MVAGRLYVAWVALAVSSQSFTYTDALSVQHRLHQHQNVGRTQRSLTITSSVTRASSSCRLNESKLCMASSSSSAATSSEWGKLTVPQLKSQLKEWNLPVSGVKAELIQRLDDHEASISTTEVTESPAASNGAARSTKSFPPPKDETEIKVMEKEVSETVRLLDGLKLGNVAAVSSSSPTQSSPRKLTREQQKEKELMASLKQSLKQSQQNAKNSVGTTTTASSASSESVQQQPTASSSTEELVHDEKLQHYIEQLRLRPANELKVELTALKLPSKGRKPDLVNRLAEYFVDRDEEGYTDINDEDEDDDEDGMIDVEMPSLSKPASTLNLDKPMSFAGIPKLSANAANALYSAFASSEDANSDVPEPTPIQSMAISKILYPPNPSVLLHAPTGSGKTIAYLLPITETLWKEVDASNSGDLSVDVNDMGNGVALILLPTRELAAQVAGVATVLAPPGMVKLVPRPMDLMNCWKDEVDRGEEFEYLEQNEGVVDGDSSGAKATTGRMYKPRILVGSAKAISTSLFGDKKMPGTPTNKPQGKQLLSSTRWLVMDEVDRLLNIKTSRSDKKSKRHEKPAAMLSAAIARLTMGRVQVIAASATVGRPLRRELARVLGLHSSECPETLRGEEDTTKLEKRLNDKDETHIGRAVKIPSTVRNYVLPVDGSTTGSLLTSAAFAAKSILKPSPDRKVLLVLTRKCDIKVHNALGALRHFGIYPEPQSLLDALEVDGTDRLVEAHRKVSGVEGVGGGRKKKAAANKPNNDDDDEGYLLVTHEDNVRGLHLDGLDAVICVGRPGSPDEYTHIAGRTGRAGRNGSVLNIVSYEQAAALASWTKMLGVDFMPVDESEVASVVDE